MKKILIASISFFLLTSCVATHTGVISSSAIGKPVKYEDMAFGVSQSGRYLGFGGHSQDGLVLEAKRELIKNRPLKQNEEYSNFTIDFKHTYWPFYTQTKVTVSADVVRYGEEKINDPYSETYKNKLSGKILLKNNLFNVGDSIYDKKFHEGIIISVESSDIVRILYNTKENKLRTKKTSINDIYSKTKNYKEFKIGDWYAYSEFDKLNETSQVAKIVALGLKSLVTKTRDNKFEIMKYNK
jgi:hypothetical protein